MFWVDLAFEWHEDVMLFRVFIFIILFRTKTSISTNTVTIMAMLSKVLSWKLIDYTYV